MFFCVFYGLPSRIYHPILRFSRALGVSGESSRAEGVLRAQGALKSTVVRVIEQLTRDLFGSGGANKAFKDSVLV